MDSREINDALKAHETDLEVGQPRRVESHQKDSRERQKDPEGSLWSPR